MDLDEIFQQIGELGPRQRKYVAICYAAQIVSAFQMVPFIPTEPRGWRTLVRNDGRHGPYKRSPHCVLNGSLHR